MSTVTISCKTPNGILMQVGKVQQKIKGWNDEERVIITSLEKVGITEEVDAGLWKSWLEQHKNHPLVVNGLIFANESTNKVKAESKERKGVKSGAEPIDPNHKQAGVEQLSD